MVGEIITVLGMCYEIGKDIYNKHKRKKEYRKYKEDIMKVDFKWWEKFEKEANKEGWKLLLTSEYRVESRKLDGWEIMYQIDESTHTRYKILVCGSPMAQGSVVMAKRS